jgi:hypothetical protein
METLPEKFSGMHIFTPCVSDWRSDIGDFSVTKFPNWSLFQYPTMGQDSQLQNQRAWFKQPGLGFRVYSRQWCLLMPVASMVLLIYSFGYVRISPRISLTIRILENIWKTVKSLDITTPKNIFLMTNRTIGLFNYLLRGCTIPIRIW